jgi:copper(I)-binding protein
MLAVPASPARAHDFKLGALRIDHPYATPTPAGARTGAAYLRTLRKPGDEPDRLIGAHTGGRLGGGPPQRRRHEQRHAHARP